MHYKRGNVVMELIGYSPIPKWDFRFKMKRDLQVLLLSISDD